MRILIIGKSQHFIAVISQNFTEATIKVIPWRSLANDHFVSFCGGHFDIVFIAGFNYSSYSMAYKNYYKLNVDSVFNFVTGLSFSSCVYIDTLTSGIPSTYSRYYFAKKALRNLLIKKYATSYNLHIYEMASLIYNGEICMNAGLIEKLFARALVLVGAVKTRCLDDCIQEIVELISASSVQQAAIVEIQPKFLFVPRTRLVDRILRLLNG